MNPGKCECCGFVCNCLICMKCKRNICCECTITIYDLGILDLYCLFCGKRYGLLLNKQQEHLESLYSPGGYQFDKAKQKLNNL